jgi:hypothetical protein
MHKDEQVLTVATAAGTQQSGVPALQQYIASTADVLFTREQFGWELLLGMPGSLHIQQLPVQHY